MTGLGSIASKVMWVNVPRETRNGDPAHGFYYQVEYDVSRGTWIPTSFDSAICHRADVSRETSAKGIPRFVEEGYGISLTDADVGPCPCFT